MRQLIRKRIRLLSNPERGFSQVPRHTFEEIVGEHVRLLAVMGLLSGLTVFLVNIAKVAYFSMFVGVHVDYLKMLNYSLGTSVSVVFFFLFAGTFLMVFLGAILKIFARRIRFTMLMSVIFYSLTPVLLFGWIPAALLPLFIWSIFLFFSGIAVLKDEGHAARGSIEERD